ncbi:hypothetical protein GCM10023169_01780 [Georgenia halophila]|uniref:Membrane protein involved in the export of O-antigen and teichoic acid n=1 Tax=Georgenia halophila TaxID=620889 RepID=A0ABP8KTE9_9MICO
MKRASGRGIINRIGISFGGRIGASLAQALLLALLARALGVESFGYYALTYAVCTFGTGVLDYGLTTRVLASSNLADKRGLFGALAVSKTLAFTIVVLGASIGALVFDADPMQRFLVLGTALSGLGDRFGDTSLNIQQGEKHPAAGTGLLLGRRLISLAPFLFGLTMTTALISLAMSAIIGIVAFYVLALPRAGRPTPLLVVLRFNRSIFLTGLGSNIAQLESAAVSLTAGVHMAGLFGASRRLSAPMNLAITTVMQVLVPEMASQTERHAREQIFRASRRTAMVLAACFLLAVPLAPWVTRALLGSAFVAASPIVGGVIAAAAFIALSQAYLGWFYATETPMSVGMSVLGSALFRLVLCLIAGVVWGPWGLAAMLPVSALATLIALHLIWRKHQPR